MQILDFKMNEKRSRSEPRCVGDNSNFYLNRFVFRHSADAALAPGGTKLSGLAVTDLKHL